MSGIVKDNTGAALPGVTVTAARVGETGEPVVEVTAGEGDFHLQGLRPGTWKLEAGLEGFQTVSKEVKLVTNQKLEVAFTIAPAFGETVNVVAKAAETGEVAILESRREAPVVSDSISSEEIRKTPDSSAAGVVERLTGVTLLGDKYVFVRGLGERYSSTTINGSTVPTTETEKRVVPLDLFPAKLLESVNVVKTYTPDKPGDFGSGVVEMTTTQFPTSQSLKATVGAGWESGTTGEPFRRYAGGLSRFGKGGQPISGGVPAGFLQRQSILNPNGLSPDQLAQIGQTFVGDWTGRESGSISPATEYALTYGNTFGRMGVVLSAVSNHGYHTSDEVQRYFGIDANNDLIPINDYTLISNRESATTGYVGNFSFRLNDQNRIYLSSVLTRDASSEDRVQEGLQTNSGGDIRDFRVRYQLEEVCSTRLRGDHNLPGPGVGSLVQWNLAYSTATNDSDLRENIYRESSPGVFQMQTGFADSGKLEYFNLDDKVQQGGLSHSTFLAPQSGAYSGEIKVGLDHFRRTRDFGARRFRFVPTNVSQFDLTQTPDQIYTSANIRPTGFEIRESTGVNDAYDAEHTVDAAFAMGDITAGKWRVIGGARYESSDQRVTTFNPFDVRNLVDSRQKNNNLLPSLNVVRQIGAQTNLRFAYGRSLNRPEFRELSPFAFTEVAGGRSVAGNPDLVQATIDALDFRWETFPTSSEVVAASVFYKRLDQPIERIVQPTTDFRQSFVNADSAKLYGIELEFRRSLGAFLPVLNLWSVNANYAHIESSVEVGEHQFSVVTNTKRPLEGQSDDVGNLALQFYHPKWGTMFRVLGSYSGDRLVEVGSFGLPDVIEQAYVSLDAVVSQSVPFARGVELKLAATNLLDAKREFLQRGEVQRRFDPGRRISLSLSYTPF
ncbi:MAG: outer membrane beta-barrel protein [Acidobacteria bacterium]|nr:outer membrane beta-barrel protein [Acidobacteriota bacterium]